MSAVMWCTQSDTNGDWNVVEGGALINDRQRRIELAGKITDALRVGESYYSIRCTPLYIKGYLKTNMKDMHGRKKVAGFMCRFNFFDNVDMVTSEIVSSFVKLEGAEDRALVCEFANNVKKRIVRLRNATIVGVLSITILMLIAL